MAGPSGLRHFGDDCLQGYGSRFQSRRVQSTWYVTTRGAYEGGGQERDLAATYRSWAQEWRFEYPFVGKILYAISKHYEKHATRQDARVNVMKRLEH